MYSEYVTRNNRHRSDMLCCHHTLYDTQMMHDTLDMCIVRY